MIPDSLPKERYPHKVEGVRNIQRLGKPLPPAQRSIYSDIVRSGVVLLDGIEHSVRDGFCENHTAKTADYIMEALGKEAIISIPGENGGFIARTELIRHDVEKNIRSNKSGRAPHIVLPGVEGDML